MTQVGPIEAERELRPRISVQIAVIGSLIVFSAYSVALGVARNLSVVEAAIGGLANTMPTIIFALIAYRMVGAWLVGRGRGVQIAGHIAFGGAFAFATYWLLMVMLGAAYGASLVRFTVEPFSIQASAWQLLQNLTIYGVVAALAYLPPQRLAASQLLTGWESAERASLSRYFIRSGDEIRPIDVAGIVTITGADDYTEVATILGRHLVRMTLAELEKSLDPTRFIRVHRSRIINVERIERAEPAGGGRLLLHMEGGETVSASRAGSRLLRDRLL